MPGWIGTTPFAGSMPESIVAATLDQRHVLGTRIQAVDPYFGGAEFMYAKTVPAIVGTGRLVVPDLDGTVADLATAAANAGFPIVVGMGPMAANSFGWFQINGLLVLQASASVAIGAPIGIGSAAGQAGTNAAGKQLLGGRVVQPSTFAVVKTWGKALNASKALTLNNTEGLVPGLVVSGTGIAGGSKVVSIDSSGNVVVLDTNTTGAVSGAVTFTYTGFVIVSAPSGILTQGAIT